MRRFSGFPFLYALMIAATLPACLPPADPYPYAPPAAVMAQAQAWSTAFEQYIADWTLGLVPDSIPDSLIPQGISDSKNFYLKDPDEVTAAETWAVRYARPINKDSLLTGIPDPKITYLFLGTALAPFGSKLVIEGEFPRCRFFSVQITQPLNGSEYYAQRQFGAAEVAVVDADIAPLPGHTNPFRLGANRNAEDRSYRLTFDLALGDPTDLNTGAHTYPYRKNSNNRTGALLAYQGPLGHKTLAGTPLPTPGDWNLGAVWVRIYEPDEGTGPLGGVEMPKVWFELPNGARYFVGSDFSALQQRANQTIANRVTNDAPNPNFGPNTGWYKSWEISRSILTGICQSNGWSRADSGARVRDIALGWTGRGEFQPSASARIEPHATTNNYISYLGRSVVVPPGQVAVLTGKLPTFPSTRNGEATMQGGQVRYWSICGIDQDPFSPLPATTVHAISDAEVVADPNRNYIIAYSRPEDRPLNATAQNGVSWVDWGTQSYLGVLMRWLCVAPDWRFPLAPHEHNLDWAHSEWTGSQYDSTLIGVNWHNGFMQCYLPRIHLLSKAEFEALGAGLTYEDIPIWVDDAWKTGASEAQFGIVSASSVLDNSPASLPANANDGNLATAWSSAFGQQQAEITIDLGQVQRISAIKLLWDWVFFARDYRIEVSPDQLAWSEVAVAEDENGQVDRYAQLQQARGQYVRITMTRFNAGWYRLAELEVYTSDADCSAAPTGVSSAAGAAACDWQLFPNPAIDFVQYACTEGAAAPGENHVDVAIYDLRGRVVYQQRQAPRAGVLRPRLPAGVYTVRLRMAGGHWLSPKQLVWLGS